MKKFKLPLRMNLTIDQYEKDLKQPLIDLGYNMEIVAKEGSLKIVTNHSQIHNFTVISAPTPDPPYHIKKRTVIEGYNPELFLALAAMTEGEDWVLGEYLIYEAHDIIFKVQNFKYYDAANGGAPNSKSARTLYRKLTKEEIFNHFKNEKMENRFPFKLMKNDALRIINTACDSWKKKLAKNWNILLLEDHVMISEKEHQTMINASNQKQLEVIDDIFGKLVFYKLGQIFYNNEIQNRYILAGSVNEAVMVNLTTGVFYYTNKDSESRTFKVKSHLKITQEEFNTMVRNCKEFKLIEND